MDRKSESIEKLTKNIDAETTGLITQKINLGKETENLTVITADVKALKNSKKGAFAFFVDLYRSIFNPKQTYANRLNTEKTLQIAQEYFVNNIQTGIVATQLKIDDATKAREDLKKELSSMQSVMKALAGEVSSTTDQCEKLSNDLITFENKASEIKDSMSELQNSAAALETQAKELEERATSAKSVATESTQTAQSALEAAIALNPSSANDIRQKIADGTISATKPAESNAATAVITPPISTENAKTELETSRVAATALLEKAENLEKEAQAINDIAQQNVLAAANAERDAITLNPTNKADITEENVQMTRADVASRQSAETLSKHVETAQGIVDIKADEAVTQDTITGGVVAADRLKKEIPPEQTAIPNEVAKEANVTAKMTANSPAKIGE